MVKKTSVLSLSRSTMRSTSMEKLAVPEIHPMILSKKPERGSITKLALTPSSAASSV